MSPGKRVSTAASLVPSWEEVMEFEVWLLALVPVVWSVHVTPEANTGEEVSAKSVDKIRARKERRKRNFIIGGRI